MGVVILSADVVLLERWFLSIEAYHLNISGRSASH